MEKWVRSIYNTMTAAILVGDNRITLKTVPSNSVQCVVTSPPYWGLRDYGVEGQLGLEDTPEEYVDNLLEVFQETRRTLRDDGVVWLNLGDSYTSGNREGHGHGQGIGPKQQTNRGSCGKKDAPRPKMPTGLRYKNLVGIPWRVAFALQADGWYLRQDIIWSKGNCMPESVDDRCTRSHEYLFMFTKQEQYFYDADAIREESSENKPWASSSNAGVKAASRGDRGYLGQPAEGTRNKRSVWNVNSRPFNGAHFAVMPPALVEPCILAGTSDAGCCPLCGAPWERLVEREWTESKSRSNKRSGVGDSHWEGLQPTGRLGQFVGGRIETTGWAPTCECPEHEPVPCMVLDPFGGSGTVGMVARWHSRNSILCEINPEYVHIIEERLTMGQGDNGGWKAPKHTLGDEVSLDLLTELMK